MITGRVTPDGREAIIPLTLLCGRAGETRSMEAVIDAGFTDRLTLPPEVVQELGLPLRGSAEVALAAGSIETLPMYRVGMLWHGQERTIRAYAASGLPPVGMALLSGSDLRIRVVGGGLVEIEELPGGKGRAA
jgi:predicted aspartyl protease